MSALLKAIGVYLGIVGTLVAWIGGGIWATATGQSTTVQALIIFSPFLLYFAVLLFGLLVYMPIASLYNYYKERK